MNILFLYALKRSRSIIGDSDSNFVKLFLRKFISNVEPQLRRQDFGSPVTFFLTTEEY